MSGSKNIIKKGFDECYDKENVNENGRFTNKMLVINKLWCKEGSLKICKISKVNVLTIKLEVSEEVIKNFNIILSLLPAAIM